MNVETIIKLNKFYPRPYQLPIIDAIENKGYKRVMAILPRRAGKDITAWNLIVRQALKKVGVYWYLLPTYSQARKVIWDSMDNEGNTFLSYIPEELIESKNDQQMKIKFKNGSLLQLVGSDNFDALVGTNARGCVFSEYALQDPRAYQYIRPILTAIDGWAVFLSTPRGKNALYDLWNIAKQSDDWFAYKLTVEDTQHVSLHEIERERASGEMSDDLIQQEWYCFPAGQHVFEYNHSKPIELIEENDLVLSHTGRFRKVLGVISRDYKGEMIEISSFGSPENIICTPNHPIQTYNQSTQSYEWKAAGLITEQDRLVFPKISLGKIPLISKDLCLLMAWYITEGSCSENKVQFTLGSEDEISEVTSILNRMNINWYVSPTETATNVVVCSVQLVDFFKSNCGLTANNKRIPLSLIGTHEIDFFHELIKGDGCFSEHKSYKKIIFSTVSKTLAYQIQVLANSLNIGYAAGISIREEQESEICGRTVYCQKSYAISISIPSLRSSHNWLIRAKNCIAASIKSIKRFDYSGTVYNLKIQYDESYLINGRAVHNCSFDLGVEGSYYVKYLDRMRLKGQIGTVPWENGFAVHTAWDIGTADSTAIIFFQIIGATVRIIDCYDKNKVGLEHYVTILNQKPYTYGKHFVPHDIKVLEFGSGLTRIEKARQLGIKMTVAPNLMIEDGIEAVRSSLSKVWIDEHSCKPLIKALENYRQEYDIKRKVYKNNPLHDWASHFCFSGDTPVLTRTGMHPIMLLQDNDEVLTLEGWKPCTKSVMTMANAQVVEVTFQGGMTVRCTPDHLFLIKESGWRSAEFLTKAIEIQSYWMNSLNILQGLCIEYGQMRSIFQREDTGSTELFGSLLLDQFLKIVTYIIEILIPSITIFGTLSAYQQKSILNNLDLIIKDLGRLVGTRRLNGTVRKLVDCGTLKMQNVLHPGQSGAESQEIVSIAVDHLIALLEGMVTNKSFATPIAKPVIIESVRLLPDRCDVWDITVPNIGHFSLGNGAIVHNSDAMRYLCISLPKTRDGLSADELDKRYERAVMGEDNATPRPFRKEPY